MTLAEANQGDTFEHDGTTYMPMIRVRNGWGCRPLLDGGEWGEHVWFDDTQEVGEFITRQPQRGKTKDRNEVETHRLGESRKEWWS